MMIDETVFGDAMTRLRGEMSRRQACRRSGVRLGTWADWESGKRQPRRSQLEKILLGLDCQLDDLEVEIWKVQTERLRDRELEQLAALDREDFRLRIEELWQLDFSDLTPKTGTGMSRMRSRIAAMWEQIWTAFEPLIADFAALSKDLRPELTRKAAEHRDDDPSS